MSGEASPPRSDGGPDGAVEGVTDGPVRVLTDGGVATTQEFYTQYARLYDWIATRTPGIGSLRERGVAHLDPRPGDVVVDVGCGTGATLPYLRERVGDTGVVVGVDFTPGMLAHARRRVERGGWDNVHVVRGDAARLPVDSVDAVFASFVSGMLGAPGEAVADWADLVGPGGRLGLMDLARTTRPAVRPLNGLFAGVVVASSPPGTWQRHGRSPTRTLDRRVAAAHRTLLERCDETSHRTAALGFVRTSGGRVR